jgi:hypothetical protein
MCADGVLVRGLDGNQDALNSFACQISDGSPQQSRVKALPAVASVDHCVEKPNLARSEVEADSKIFFMVEGRVKPHIGQEFLAVGKYAGASADIESMLDDLVFVAEGNQKTEILEARPANRDIGGDRCAVVCDYL